MFDNTIIVKDKTASTNHKTVSLRDMSVAGRSIRENGDGASLVISSLLSKENPGYETRRTMIRWEYPLTGGSNVLQLTAKTRVQVVISQPIDGSWGTEQTICTPFAGLVNFLYSGGNAGALVVQADNATLIATLDRLRNLEI
jgi:hypothetical protein